MFAESGRVNGSGNGKVEIVNGVEESKYARTHCCNCGEFVVDDGLFKESGSRELTEKESKEEDTK